jgi:hypothetical protein
MHANALWNFGILQYPEFVLKFVVFVKLGKQGTAEVISCSHEPGLASLDESCHKHFPLTMKGHSNKLHAVTGIQLS